MKLGINIAIAVVLVLLLLSRPVVLSEMMHHGLVKAAMLCLVVITTVRETCLGVLAAVVFVVLSENVREGLDLKNVLVKGKELTEMKLTGDAASDDDEDDKADKKSNKK